jgi:ABC-type phosphate transport system ATPase subunit
MAIIIVTHAAEQAQRLAQRIFRLERGQLTMGAEP